MARKPQKSAISSLENVQESDLLECCQVASDGQVPDLQERAASPEIAQRYEHSTLDGHLARRAVLAAGIYWDDEVRGFGLRVRKGGARSWIVKLGERGEDRWVMLGRAEKLDVITARDKARALLTDAALDGLPRKPRKRAVPLFRDYAREFWRDYAHHWKASTQTSNRSILRRRLLPEFGDLGVEQIRPTDIARWRDGMADESGAFNRALPVLAVMLIDAEQLGYRRKGSNPCKGVGRYKRKLPDRYLSPAEYRRLARTLDENASEDPNVIAAIRLLMFTGARSGEISGLKWSYVQPPRLMLPDSKTGPKIV